VLVSWRLHKKARADVFGEHAVVMRSLLVLGAILVAMSAPSLPVSAQLAPAAAAHGDLQQQYDAAFQETLSKPVADPDDRATITLEGLSEPSLLTAAGATIVGRIAMGTTLRATASDLEVSTNTARTLLADAMVKVGAGSQVSLVPTILLRLIRQSAALRRS
jgi:DNA-binding CsgD family transcriptional regulator